MTTPSMLKHAFATVLGALMLSGGASAAPEATAVKPRLVVLTDIENEPDDTQSLVRLLLYANDIELRGLVATTSVHMRQGVHPESIRRVIERYGQVLPRLRQHDAAYPDAVQLLARVAPGQPGYGLQAIGDNLFVETPASGPPQDGVPNTDGMGDLQQGNLEQANVEAVTEISDLIAAQRAYEMNGKVITAADQMLSATSNLMR